MGRTEWLTPIARERADKLAARCGSLKKVMSAGIMAFDSLSSDDRERFMALAEGIETADEPQQAAENIRHFMKIFPTLDEKDQAFMYQFLDDNESKVVQAMNRELVGRLRPVGKSRDCNPGRRRGAKTG